MADSKIPLDAFTPVRLADWSRLRRELRRFAAGRGDTAEVGDRLVYRSGGAAFAVTRDGHVDAGMPLHEFSVTGIDFVHVDRDGGRLLVRGPGGLEYLFRRP
jgi:hypothetical protein